MRRCFILDTLKLVPIFFSFQKSLGIMQHAPMDSCSILNNSKSTNLRKILLVWIRFFSIIFGTLNLAPNFTNSFKIRQNWWLQPFQRVFRDSTNYWRSTIFILNGCFVDGLATYNPKMEAQFLLQWDKNKIWSNKMIMRGPKIVLDIVANFWEYNFLLIQYLVNKRSIYNSKWNK